MMSDLWRIAEEYKDIGAILQLESIKSFAYNGYPLRRCLEAGPGKIDETTGRVVGKLFKLLRLDLKDKRMESFAILLARCWRFGDRTKKDAFNRYLRGLHTGFYSLDGNKDENLRRDFFDSAEDIKNQVVEPASNDVPSTEFVIVEDAGDDVDDVDEDWEILGSTPDVEDHEPRPKLIVESRTKMRMQNMIAVEIPVCRTEPAQSPKVAFDRFISERARVNKAMRW